MLFSVYFIGHNDVNMSYWYINFITWLRWYVVAFSTL